MRFEDIPMPDERVVRLADASRTLFVQQRQMRDRLAARAGLSAVEYTAVMGVTDAGG